MRRVYWAVALAAVVCLSIQARADVKPSPLFSDGMVLQQGVKCPIFGTADPDEEVSVSIGGGNGLIVAAPPIKADKNGRWAATLGDVAPAGGPFTLTIKGKNTVTVKDVLVGEVWVASGQSNMEMNLASCAGGKEAVADSRNPKIRLFTVPHKIAAEPTTELQGKWVECGPDTVANFSGVAYYFARDLQKALNVPVGVIESNWGGTVAEAWTPKANLESNPDLKNLIPAEIKIDEQEAQPQPGDGPLQRHDPPAPAVRDQGRHLVPGRVERQPRLPVPHPVPDHDRELARAVAQPRHAVPVRPAGAV